MKLPNLLRVMLTLGGISAAVLTHPVRAEIPLMGARINAFANEVEILSPSGIVRPVSLEDCFCTGDVLITQSAAQAELLFNDGSVARLGEQSKLNFWPQTRQLRLMQGTTLLFVPPEQGRMLVYTPNVITGIQNNAAVVRYVPSSGLTLVMSLADSDNGTVSITTKMRPREEFALAAGQMALVKDSVVQIVEFELLEFYETSSLIAGLNPRAANFPGRGKESIVPLRSALISAVEQQSSFSGSSPMLDPTIIRVSQDAPGLFAAGEESLSPMHSGAPVEELRRYDDAPPGVVTPLPDMPATERPEEPQTEPIAPTEPPLADPIAPAESP